MQRYRISVFDYDMMSSFTTELSNEGIEFKPGVKPISSSQNGLVIDVATKDVNRFEILCANKGISVNKINKL